MNRDLSRLVRRLGYSFADQGLLTHALTHRSAGGLHNERLEFLGDALLGYFIADQLYQRYPDAQEGELTRFRATLVRRETLAELARELALGDYLMLGSGELKSGGFRRDSILADALEAVIAAIYLDGGIDPCRDAVSRLFALPLANLSSVDQLKDSKTRLQEYLQGRRLPLPIYTVLSITGIEHDQVFQVECRLENIAQPTAGVGNTRRRAEQEAARRALEILGIA